MQHVQTRSTTSALVLTAVLIALATLFTMYTKIPVPGIRGYFNVGDVVIMTSALLLGRKYGAYIGAIGPALADLFLGYAVFVPITFVVKGIEGYLVGTVYNNKTTTSALVATIVGGIVIVAGYFIAEYFVFDPGVAIASILTNTIQAVMSVIISMILYAILRKRLGYYNKLKAQIELLEAIALAEEDERKGRMGPIEDTFISIEQLLAEAE